MLPLATSINAGAQYIFDINYIHSFEIDFYDADWDHKLDSLATLNTGTGSGTGRILADVTINGIQYDSCGVRYKGNSSMDTTSNKNPFNIDLNYVIAGQEHQGKDKFKLANCFTDPSMIREALMYELSNQYMDCPRATFTKVFINGDYRGLYTNTESIDNEFLDEHYGSSDNAFFKCDPVSFEIFGDNSNLAYHADSMAYDTLYDMKSLHGLAELQAFTWELENNSSTIENHLDVDRALWFLALSSAFVHNDGYTAFAHNFYVYKMDNNRWSIVLWDVNMSFGGLLWNGTNLWPVGITELQEQDPFIHITPAGFRPLIAQLLSIPQYNRMYVSHYRTILEENVTNNYYMQRAQWWHDLIDPEVPNEPYPFYTYQNFVDNLTQDVGILFDMRPGIENLMSAREVYLYSLPEFQQNRPDISNIVTPVTPAPFTTITVTAEITNANYAYLGYRDNEFDVFTKVEMFDDGAHNDGAAGDDVYGVDIPVTTFAVQYYIYAENATAGRFAPARAEYEFYLIEPEKGLVINELSAFNSTIIADVAGEYDDWIEIYNNTTGAIQLNDYFLSDDPNNLYKWNFPPYSMPAGAYNLIWADNDLLQTGFHCNFQLNSGGEALYLSTLADSVIDMIIYPVQNNDITYGRLPNGVGNFNYLLPTPGANNQQLAGSEKEDSFDVSIYPNPATDWIQINTEQEVNAAIQLYNLNGQIVLEDQMVGNYHHLEVSHLPKGNYILRIGKMAKKLILQ